VQQQPEPIWTPDQINRALATSVQIAWHAGNRATLSDRKPRARLLEVERGSFRPRMVELFRLAGKTEAEARMLASQLLGLDDGLSGRVRCQTGTPSTPSAQYPASAASRFRWDRADTEANDCSLHSGKARGGVRGIDSRTIRWSTARK
jgi:hypothetical protein